MGRSSPCIDWSERLNVGFDVQDLFVQVTVVIHLKATLLLAGSTTGEDDCLLCCGRGSGFAGTQNSDPSRRNTSFPPIKWEFLVLQFRSKMETHPAVIVTTG
jgi:hypothetical protein